MSWNNRRLTESVIGNFKDKEENYEKVRPSNEAVLYHCISGKLELKAFNLILNFFKHTYPAHDQSYQKSADKSGRKEQAEYIWFKDFNEIIRIIEEYGKA